MMFQQAKTTTKNLLDFYTYQNTKVSLRTLCAFSIHM